MQKVVGYLAEDGKFFIDEADARYHDASVALHSAFTQFVGATGKFRPWITVLINLGPEIEDFFNAHKAKIEVEKKREAERTAAAGRHAEHRQDDSQHGFGQDQTDTGLGEAFGPDVEQPFRGPDDLSDLGPRTLEEALRDLGESDGVGVRRGHAQSVRIRSDMAIDEIAEDEEARHLIGGTRVRL